MPDTAIAPGDVLAGKYRVEGTLGSGGMGYVVGARHLQLDERVAIKILHPGAARDGEAVARFFREARAASRIKGEHVVRVLDVGSLDDATPFIVMEHLEGSDLANVVERNGPLPVGLAIDYVLQACEALAEAHAVGIVHRDVKPSNLFLTTRIDGTPCVKVLDFGISKAMGAVDATRPDFGMTRTQSVLGSPQYMAPEQMRSSRRVDGRTDIWAIGTIVHELLTGEAPFVAGTMPELFAMILTDPTPSLRRVRPDAPEELDRVVARCLEKEPDRRYPNVLEVATALAPFAATLDPRRIDRIARVTQNAAATAARGSSPAIAVGLPLPPPPITSSDPLSLAKTTVDPELAPPRSGVRVPLVAGGFAGLALIGGTLTFLALSRAPARPGPIAPALEEPSMHASVDSAPVAPPPSAEPAAPPSAVAAPAGASVAATTRPTASKTVPRASSRAPASAAPAASAATTATTKPAATATSRYD